MTQRTPNEEPQIKVARISALQAVVVATITAGAGVLAGYISRPSVHDPPKQTWIVLDGAEAEEIADLAGIRVVLMVNGLHFSYPTNSVWTEVGPRMSQERFPLPSEPYYTVSFRAFLSRSGNREPMFAGDANYVDRISEVPSGERTYLLYPVHGVFRGDAPFLKLRYHIE
jgi:hypothetical protein